MAASLRLFVLAAFGIGVWQLIRDPDYRVRALPVFNRRVHSVRPGELPFCCTCIKFCKFVAKFLRIVAGYWAVRSVLFLGEGMRAVELNDSP